MTHQIHGPGADEPTRTYTKTTITLGLMNIEVDLLTGTKAPAAGLERHSYVVVEDDGQQQFHPVGNKPYDKITFADVDKDAIVKGVDVGSEVVVITQDELNSFGLERGTAPISGFVRPDEQQQRWLLATQIYQIRPSKKVVGKAKRPNRAAEQIFSLLLRALERHDCLALVSLSLQDGGAKRHGLIDKHGRLTILRYGEELREDLPLDLVEVSAEDEALMDQFVERLSMNAVPELLNERGAHLQALVEAKLAGGEIGAVSVTTTSDDADVTDLLRASLQ